MDRYRSLDGLRGVAALAVVFWHVSLVVPAFTDVILRGEEPAAGSVAWWLTRTPFAAFEVGHEAVLLFFILSGFVLTLQLNRGPLTSRRMREYYGRRLTRLYVPVWAAVGLAVVLALLVARNPNAPSLWLATHDAPSPTEVMKGATLLAGSTGLNTPLWSLTWEIWFSLTLPLILLTLRWVRMEKWWPVAIALCIATSASAAVVQWSLPIPALAMILEYPPVFVVGVIIALKWQQIISLTGHVPWLFGLVLVAAVTAAQSMVVASPLVEATLHAGTLIGLAFVVVAAVRYGPFGRVLEVRPVHWLGSRSFSLYLIHEPIIVAMALLVGAAAWWPWLLIALGTLPLILAGTELFYRMVERPSLRLSKKVGSWAAGSVVPPEVQTS